MILWKAERESGGGEVDVLEKAVTENGHWGLLARFCFNLLSSGVRTNFTELGWPVLTAMDSLLKDSHGSEHPASFTRNLLQHGSGKQGYRTLLKGSTAS